MAKFKVGDYITYNESVGIQLAKITEIKNNMLYVDVIEKTHWHNNQANTEYLEECDHVWKVNYVDTPLWKLLVGEE